jgi:hypothetical protein
MCWASLSSGDVASFNHETTVASGFGEFAAAAGLLADHDDDG